MSLPKRLVVGLSGASGMPYALDLLKTLRRIPGLETHLVMTQGAKRVLLEEVGTRPEAVEALADVVHRSSDLGAAVASGSFRTLGMVVVPCSATTLAKVAYGLADNLLTRAAYVTLKERRPLVLVPRETPLPLPSLEAMVKAAQAGAVILPAAPGFYHRPAQIDDLLAFITQRILDLFDLDYPRAPRWKEAVELELD
ncbi:UbiX family flavin prenyltransferase [Meiothermus rufus]|uniref:UbiX family flavin prenyltransferase n=1 Tax=Meiothermus rufus TaxID=604332 RepID=UPI00041B77FE|nr:UbiX family flavin prenyltransferase [Meiothermus rufus]